MPPKYLPQILIELKAQGIVRSVRGKAGGYLLARPPAEITLGDVLRAVHGAAVRHAGAERLAAVRRNCGARGGSCSSPWKTAADAITFQQLLEESAEKEKMYYI